MKRPRVEIKIVIAVIAASVVFLSAGAVFYHLSEAQIRTVVVDGFNAEQAVVADHVARWIERDLDVIRREMVLLKKGIREGGGASEIPEAAVRDCLSRVMEMGVQRIEGMDLESGVSHVFLPYGVRHIQQMPDAEAARLAGLRTKMANGSGDGVVMPPSEIRNGVLALRPILFLDGKQPGALVFQLNLSWFLTPFLKEIRSGRTGYAWLIDETGRFIYHPDTEMIGKNAFSARQERDPAISYEIVHTIQREKMLKGLAGTGWYYSGWHRGYTGPIRKMIAYRPIFLSEDRSRLWSVAVVAPVSEIEDVLHQGARRRFILLGLVIAVVVAGAGAVLFFEFRWSATLARLVDARTQALKRSEEKYRSLVESAEDFIFTVDADGRLLTLNSYTAHFFGGSAEQFAGQPLSVLFPPEAVERQLKWIRRVFRHGRSIRGEYDIDMGSQRLWINASLMPLRNEDGKVGAVLVIARDVTETKNLEKQLVNAEKLASLGTLAAGVAHEINNPLGVILGFCDILLRKAEKGSRDHEDLKIIERQGLLCKEVVENLLSFARTPAAAAESCALNGCVAEILRVVRHTLEINDIELETLLGEAIPPVRIDHRQLQQVLLNLITNAAAAMSDGGRLRIETGHDPEARRAVIVVEDTGTGIDPVHLDRIFEPFFTTKPEGQGTGLGLFVSYGIVTKHGGTIEAANRGEGDGAGARFTVRLLTEASAIAARE
jgi:PAS domain S-box-containing protein